MRIVCPQCGYSRDIPTDKVPARSSIATCPKCQFRFRFRGRDSLPVDDPASDEPVYPPRPSRPRTDWNPGPATPPPSFEPSQKLYAADPEPERYAQTPPRPQARWLPDPEPEFGPIAEPPAPPAPEAYPEAYEVAPRTRRAPDPSRDDRPDPGLRDPGVSGGQDAQPPQARTSPLPAQEWEPPQTFSRLGQPGRPEPGPATAPTRIWTHEPRPEAEVPEDFAQPGPSSPDVDPWDVREHDHRAAYPIPGERSGAADAAGPIPDGNSGGDEAAQDEPVQPSEAVAGEDSVRDIWARLQAMGGETRSRAVPAQPQAGDEPEAAHAFRQDGPAPWEQLEHYGVVPAYLNTAKAILLKPGDFFDQLPPLSGVFRPLVFALVTCVAAVIAGIVWNYFGLGPNFSELGRTDGFQGLGTGALGGLALLGLAPILLAGFAYLDAGLAHLLLGLLRSATRPFAETFRTLCYAGAPWLLSLLPVPYSYLIPVILIWHMTLQAIGLKKLHQAGYPQVLAAVLVKWSLYFMASFALLHVLITRR